MKRAAILTVGTGPWACYLARRLRNHIPEIVLLDQRAFAVEPDSWPFLRRLWRRRGPLVATDYAALLAVKACSRLALRAAGRVHPRWNALARDPAGLPPVLRPDPGIVSESWLRRVELENINSVSGLEALQRLAPDLLLLAGAPILGRRAIAAARVACLNPHCGITPDYCGSSPCEWPFFERRFDAIGYTVHLVTSVVDAGPVLHQERIAWDLRRSSRALWPVLAQAMYDKLADLSIALASGERLEARPQGPPHVRPPAGLVVRVLSEWRRKKEAGRRAA